MKRFYWVATLALVPAFLAVTGYFCSVAQSVEGFGAFGLIPIIQAMLAIAFLSLSLGLFALATAAIARHFNPIQFILGLLLLAPAGFWMTTLVVRQYTEALSICTPYGL